MSADNSEVRELDVRDLDEPPFGRIMSALGELGSDETLLLINSFEPAPLYDVLEEQGFTHESEQVGEDEWHVRIQQD